MNHSFCFIELWNVVYSNIYWLLRWHVAIARDARSYSRPDVDRNDVCAINANLNYSISVCSLRTEQPSGLGTGAVRLELSRALALWSENSKLTFQEVNSDRADILVFFHR